MIFVTVGTHEDPFDRLVMEIDRLIEIGCVKEEVFVQTGYSSYKPVHCKHADCLGYKEMDANMKAARIVITHGGPGSIMHSLKYKTIPIVVPRRKAYGEHVDDHQVLFTQRLAQANQVIIVLEISELEKVIADYEGLLLGMNQEFGGSNNLDRFIMELENITRRLLVGKF